MTDLKPLKVYDGYKFVIVLILTTFLLSFFQNISLFYGIVTPAATSIFAYFSRDKPIWVKVVWWGSYSHCIVNTIKQAMEVCDICMADHIEPNWNCRNAIFDLIHSLRSIFVTLTIGFHDYLNINGFINIHNPNSRRYHFFLFLLSIVVIYFIWVFIYENRVFLNTSI